MTNETINFYEVLGVKHDCSQEDIKKAYRDLSKRYHPDRAGGDKESFTQIAEAYTILSDSKKRKEYDITGTVVKQDAINQMALKSIVAAFASMLRNEIPDGGDPIESLNNWANKNINQAQNEKRTCEGRIKKLKNIKKRLKYKKKKKSFLDEMVRQAITQEEAKKYNAKNNIKVYKRALVILKDYSYETEEHLMNMNQLYAGRIYFGGTTTATGG